MKGWFGTKQIERAQKEIGMGWGVSAGQADRERTQSARLRMTGMLAGKDVAVAVIYLLTGAASGEKNKELVRCIKNN